jgi:hypothetical protein
MAWPILPPSPRFYDAQLADAIGIGCAYCHQPMHWPDRVPTRDHLLARATLRTENQ